MNGYAGPHTDDMRRITETLAERGCVTISGDDETYYAHLTHLGCIAQRSVRMGIGSEW